MHVAGLKTVLSYYIQCTARSQARGPQRAFHAGPQQAPGQSPSQGNRTQASELIIKLRNSLELETDPVTLSMCRSMAKGGRHLWVRNEQVTGEMEGEVANRSSEDTAMKMDGRQRSRCSHCEVLIRKEGNAHFQGQGNPLENIKGKRLT